MITRPSVLIVACHFPPIGGSGVQRALKLARHLPDAGWNVHVLTTGHTHYPLLDPSISDELGEDVVVHRVRGLDPGGLAATLGDPLGHRRVSAGTPAGPSSGIEDRIYWRLERLCGRFRLPEPETLWIRAATRAARRIIAEHHIDAVLTTSPPHSTQWIGRRLNRLTGIPWIADLRDPIVDNFGYRPQTRRIDRYWHRLERAVALDATRVVVTCPEAGECLRRRHPAAPAERFATITNGYDPTDRPAADEHCGTGVPPVESQVKRERRFVISHIGAFYRAQTLQPLLDAVRQLTARRPDLLSKLTLRLVGSISVDQRRLLRGADDAFLQIVGYRPHREAVAEMADADALFLMTPAHEAGRNCIPAKTFEYLAFGGHIIALIHGRSSTARILAEAGNTTRVEHGDATDLAIAIEERFDRWTTGEPPQKRNTRFVEQFRRDALAREYAAVLTACLERGSGLRHRHLACESTGLRHRHLACGSTGLRLKHLACEPTAETAVPQSCVAEPATARDPVAARELVTTGKPA